MAKHSSDEGNDTVAVAKSETEKRGSNNRYDKETEQQVSKFVKRAVSDSPSSGSDRDSSSVPATSCDDESDRISSDSDTERQCLPYPFYFYRDHSQEKDDDPALPVTSPSHAPNFPAKMHVILSRPDLEDIISWLPHGRSWRILDSKEFERKVLSQYFDHRKFSSFIRQTNGWGFRRITTGCDRNTYYHELFLRGMPFLCKKMKRPGVGKKITGDPYREPNFYEISKLHPIPDIKLDCNIAPSLSLATPSFALQQGTTAPTGHTAAVPGKNAPDPIIISEASRHSASITDTPEINSMSLAGPLPQATLAHSSSVRQSSNKQVSSLKQQQTLLHQQQKPAARKQHVATSLHHQDDDRLQALRIAQLPAQQVLPEQVNQHTLPQVAAQLAAHQLAPQQVNFEQHNLQGGTLQMAEQQAAPPQICEQQILQVIEHVARQQTIPQHVINVQQATQVVQQLLATSHQQQRQQSQAATQQIIAAMQHRQQQKEQEKSLQLQQQQQQLITTVALALQQMGIALPPSPTQQQPSAQPVALSVLGVLGLTSPGINATTTSVPAVPLLTTAASSVSATLPAQASAPLATPPRAVIDPVSASAAVQLLRQQQLISNPMVVAASPSSAPAPAALVPDVTGTLQLLRRQQQQQQQQASASAAVSSAASAPATAIVPALADMVQLLTPQQRSSPARSTPLAAPPASAVQRLRKQDSTAPATSLTDFGPPGLGS